MTNEPLYLGTFEDARQAGEQEAWTASRNANIACRDAIDKEIAQNFDGMHLGSGVVDRVVQEFGADRVKYVLATNIQDMAWDGRISPSNKGWAANAPAATEPFRVAELRLRCHPAVLDGYVRMFRRDYPEPLQQLDGQVM